MSLSSFYSQLSSQSKQHCVRQLVFVVGDSDLHQAHLNTIQSCYPQVQGLGVFDDLIFSGQVFKKGKQALGSESQAMVVRGEPFSVDDFACVAGTICGGGLLVVLLKETEVESSRFLQRLKALSSPADGVYWCEFNQALPTVLPLVGAYPCTLFENGITHEQQSLLDAIDRVAFGHRYRPLIVTADRGRGKSHALGLAALSMALKAKMTVLVISAHFSSVSGLFNVLKKAPKAQVQSNSRIQIGESFVQFAAMDAVLLGEVSGDVYLVDEAASIPVPLLLQLAKYHPRVVYASTLHGYEGTGKGFGLTFQKQLRDRVKKFHHLTLTQPIRWAANDPLELWLNRVLLLDAEVPAYSNIASDIRIERFSHADEWAEETLKTVFSLLVQAHYQTCPSDLLQILDDKETHVCVAFAQNAVVGACILKEEGRIDATLSDAIVLGQRRIRGHLMPQSIATHLGLLEALSQLAYRIQRIVVHPDCRRRGVALRLLSHIENWAQSQGVDYLGSSFAYNESVADFWQASMWQAIRLGVLKDKASGCHSMMVVQPLSVEAKIWVTQAQSLFATNFLAQSSEVFSALPEALFLRCYRQSLQWCNLPLCSSLFESQVRYFAQGGLGYELICGSLLAWTNAYLQYAKLPSELSLTWQVMVRKVLQKQSWQCIARELNLAGRRETEKLLREWYQAACRIYTVNNEGAKFTV